MSVTQLSKLLVAAVALAGIVGCSGIENPISRQFNWFHYVDAESIRASCRPGALDQYRFVYNADWSEQVRAYDLRASALQDGSAILWTQVFGGYSTFNATNFSITDPLAGSRGTSGQVRITPDQYRALVQALDASGFREATPTGLRLESWDFYWVVAACMDGQFHFNAWRYPSPGFAALKFPTWLFALDGTGVPPNPPRPVNSAEEYTNSEFPRSLQPGGNPYTFELIVGSNGLAGLPPSLF